MISSSFEPITIIADNYRNKGNIWVRSKGTILPAHVLSLNSIQGIDKWCLGICDGEGNVRRGKQTQVFKLRSRDSCEGHHLNRILNLGSALESQPLLTVNPSDIFSYSRCSLFGWSPSKPSWQVPGTPQASYPTLCSCTLIPGANVVYSIKLMCICLLCGRQPDFSTYWSENSGGTQRCGLVSSFLIASSDCRPFRCSAAAPCWSYS